MKVFHHKARTRPCFVCEVVAGTNDEPQHIVHEDGEAIAFLESYPRAYGHTLVAPKEHREQVTKDFSVEEYLRLQRFVYRVAEAVREEVGAERMYLYTFGSNQGIAHVHWHVVPLPPGVPYEEQQGAWASWSKGVLDIPQEEMASLAARSGARMG
jgi:diadenosine tetraphosphate (Ap4A) HIT family hydrolase